MKLYHKKNGWLHIVDGATFWVGVSLVSFTVIIPAYVHKFTDSAFLLALVPFIMEFGMYGMQPVTTFLFKNKDSRATINIYFWTEFIHRLSFIAIGLSIFVFGHNTNLALISFFIFWAISNISWGMAIPHWVDILSITIPDKVRANFLGQRELISRLTGVAASLAVPFILLIGRFPNNYGVLFLIAGILFSSGALFFKLFEPLHPFTRKEYQIPDKFRDFMRQGLAKLLSHKSLLPFLYAIWAMSVSRLTYAYFTPYIIENILPLYSQESGDLLLSILNTSLLVFTALASFMTGKILHHVGHKAAMIWGAFSIIAANVLILTWHSFASVLIANFFLAMFMGNTFMVSLNVIMDYTHASERSRFIAFNNVINILFILAFGVIGSIVADKWGYGSALWIVVAAMSVVLLSVIFSKSLTSRGIARSLTKE